MNDVTLPSPLILMLGPFDYRIEADMDNGSKREDELRYCIVDSLGNELGVTELNGASNEKYMPRDLAVTLVERFNVAHKSFMDSHAESVGEGLQFEGAVPGNIAARPTFGALVTNLKDLTGQLIDDDNAFPTLSELFKATLDFFGDAEAVKNSYVEADDIVKTYLNHNKPTEGIALMLEVTLRSEGWPVRVETCEGDIVGYIVTLAIPS